MQTYLGFLVLLATSALALPAVQEAKDPSLWRGTAMDAVVRDLESSCTQKNDGISCIKYKVLNLIDQALMKDNIQVTSLGNHLNKIIKLYIQFYKSSQFIYSISIRGSLMK